MMRLISDVRLVPVVLVAAVALFVLKFTGIVATGGYTLGAGHMSQSDRVAQDARVANERNNPPAVKVASAPAPAPKKSWAQEVLGYPDVTGSVAASKGNAKGDVTGSAPKPAEKKEAEKKDEKPKPAEPKPSPNGVVIPLEPQPMSQAERALLERLTERRQELDQRERELSMRETLLQAQEKKLEEKVTELKDVEAKIQAATQKKQDAELARLKSLVTMYENMKAKDAAKIFERLDIRLATEVANQIAPRRMSDILALMSPEAAERLTVELANRNAEKAQTPDLPKIEGRPGS